MNNSENCYFSHEGKCGILTEKGSMYNEPVICSGADILCKFRKNEEEYINSYNESIMMNRAKGNCDRCRYKRNVVSLSALTRIKGGIQ